MADGFRQFARNGRWGTCCDCPVDAAGHAYPEFCVNTNRYDHQLLVTSLAEQFNGDLTATIKAAAFAVDGHGT